VASPRSSPVHRQFLLFGGEEEVTSGPQVRSSEPPDEWRYPHGAFPPDPWDALRLVTVRELEEARSSGSVRRALCRYFKRGLSASFHHGELVDLLCVSNDLLAEAGFSPVEGDRVLEEVLPAITQTEVAATSLD